MVVQPHTEPLYWGSGTGTAPSSSCTGVVVVQPQLPLLLGVVEAYPDSLYWGGGGGGGTGLASPCIGVVVVQPLFGGMMVVMVQPHLFY